MRAFNLVLFRSNEIIFVPPLFVLATNLFFVPSVRAQPRNTSLPTIFADDTNGNSVAVEEDKLCNFEMDLLRQFARKDAPDEIIAFASDEAHRIFFPALGKPVEYVAILVYGKQGEVRWNPADSSEHYYYRQVPATEIDEIRDFLATNKVESLPELGALQPDGRTRIGGVQHVYLHLNARSGRRILINNPPFDKWEAPEGDPSWRYTKVVDFFRKFTDLEKLQVRYTLDRPIKGLEVLYARPDKEAVAVWKQDGDVCVTVRHRWNYNAQEEHRVLRDGKLAEKAADPNRSIQHSVELGATKLRPACASSDGRYTVGNRRDDGELICYDRQQMKFVPVLDEPTRTRGYPLYYLESRKAFLLGYPRVSQVPRARSNDDWRGLNELRLLDPATGRVSEVKDQTNRSLWLQDLPRRLQPVREKEHVVWAAVSRENATKVGQFDLKEFRWLDYELIPLKFQITEFCVDESHEKVYVVYKGHLLRLPFPVANENGDRKS